LFCAVGWPFICSTPLPGRQAAQQVQVVDRYRRRGRLVRLVEALEHRGQDILALAENTGRPAKVLRVDPTDLLDLLGAVGVNDAAQLVHADRVRQHPVVLDPAVLEQLARQTVHQGQVGADSRRQVNPAGAPGLLRHGGEPWVHADQPRRRLAAGPVQDAHPQDGLGFGHVVAEQEDCVAVLDVGVRAWLAVGAEGLLEGGRCRRRAQAGVAVHVRRPQSCLPDHPQRVVLLDEHLTRRVEAMGEWTLLRQQPL